MRYITWKTLLVALGLCNLAVTGVVAQTFQSMDIGDSPFVGYGTTTITTEPDGTQVITIKAGGHDIWDSADDFRYYFTRKTGGFDVVVKVRSLYGSNNWAKAELMVRCPADEFADPQDNDPHISMVTTRVQALDPWYPTVSGQNEIRLQERVNRGGSSSGVTPSPVVRPTYPDTWLRMQRVGNVFTGYYSTNGTNWQLLEYRDKGGDLWPDTVFVGLAVTSHVPDSDEAAATALAQAVFSNLEFKKVPPDVIQILPRHNSSYVPINTNFIFTVRSPVGANTSDIKLFVNGVDKSSGLTFAGTAQERNCTYPGPFEPNVIYTFNIKVKDIEGTAGEATINWDTIQESNFTIEAEDFNFNRGRFIDNPALSGTPAPNNYLDKEGVQGVDRWESYGNGSHEYRRNDPAWGVAELIGNRMIANQELNNYLRTKFVEALVNDPSVMDYQIGWNVPTEWWNYTRTFPQGRFKILARIAVGGSSFVIRWDRVTSDPSQPNQTTMPIGTFSSPSSTYAYDNFAFFTLKDLNGNDVVLSLGGVQTMRGTFISGGMDANFYMLLPDSSTDTLGPYVSYVYPAKTAANVFPQVPIEAYIANRDVKVKPASVKLYLNGNSVTPTVTASDAGVGLLYTPAQLLAFSSTNTVQLEFEDDSAQANKQTNSWTFIVRAAPTINPAATYASAGSGQTPGMTVRAFQALGPGASGSTAWSESILTNGSPSQAFGFDTPLFINYWGAGGRGNFDADTDFANVFTTLDPSLLYTVFEAVAWVELKRGAYTMGVNSDDGFRLTMQMPDRSAFTTIAENSGTRSAANTEATFLAPTNGLYQFRLTYYNWTGSREFEWYCFDPIYGYRILINYTNNPSALRAYRFNTAAPAVTIAEQPANITVQENHPATFIVRPVAGAMTNVNAFLYQWRENGIDLPLAMYPTANFPTLVIPRPTIADSGKRYQVRVIPLGYQPEITSAEAALTVVPDTTPPKFTTLLANPNPTSVVLVFDEAVAGLPAMTLANYQITSAAGPLNITSATLTADEKTVVLETAPQTPGTRYTVTVNNITDIAPTPNVIAPNSRAIFYTLANTLDQAANGMVVFEAEFFTRNTPATDGDTFELRTALTNFSGNGYMLVPNGRGGGNPPPQTAATLEYEINFVKTGTHYLWVRGSSESTSTGNDDSVYVGVDRVKIDPNTDNNYSGMTGFGNYTSWVWSRSRQSGSGYVNFTVNSVGKHTLNIWHREDGSQLDKFIITTDSSYVPSGFGPVETRVGLPPAPVVAITSPANGAKFPAEADITLNVDASSRDDAIVLVEFFSGTTKVGEDTSSPYSLTLSAVAEGDYTFTAKATDALGFNTTSAPINVRVDSTKPVVEAVGSLRGNTIGVFFSEPMDVTTAVNTANYTVNNGQIAVSSVALEPDGKTAVLALSAPVTSSFAVKVENVADRGFGPNVVEPTTLTGTVVSFLTASDIGVRDPNNPALFTNPIEPGLALSRSPKDFNVRGGGVDIWSATDGFHYLYMEKTGEFDLAVRVISVERRDPWSKAGLMAREDLDADSRNVMILAAPATGQNLINTQWRETKGTSSASLATALRPTPVPYPNAWLRLKRETNTFRTYWGTNGTDWIELYAYTPASPYPAKVYVGMAVTSHNNGVGQSAKGEFRDFTDLGAPALPPTLTITRSGNDVVISWPTAEGTGFVLEATPSLSAPTWSAPNVIIVPVGANSTVTLPARTGNLFFRLKK